MSRPPSQRPIEVDLGVQRLGVVEFRVRVVLRPARLASFIAAAMKSRDGRAELGGGAVAVLAKRTQGELTAAPTSADRGGAERRGR